MVGGTTANDFSNCELKVMKQQEEQKQPQPQRQKQNPLGKGKTGMRFGWRAGIQRQGYALVCAKLALDILVVVIDRMTGVEILGEMVRIESLVYTTIPAVMVAADTGLHARLSTTGNFLQHQQAYSMFRGHIAPN